jgi:hypothetical protein
MYVSGVYPVLVCIPSRFLTRFTPYFVGLITGVTTVFAAVGTIIT